MMNKEFILDFIINGVDVFGTSIYRVSLVEIFGEMEAFFKLIPTKPIYEILKKDKAYFYVGGGTLGYVHGIRMIDLEEYNFNKPYIESLLTIKKIGYQQEDYIFKIPNKEIVLYFKEDLLFKIDQGFFLREIDDIKKETDETDDKTIITVASYGLSPDNKRSFKNWENGEYKRTENN